MKVVMADVMSKFVAIRQSLSLASGQILPLRAEGPVPTDGQSHSSALPLTSSATPSSYHTKSDVSTVSSSYQGLSSLWFQLLITKCIVQIFSKREVKEKCEDTIKPDGPAGPQPVKISLEFEGFSLQVDVQEKCTDFVLKLAGVESCLSVKEEVAKAWEPLLTHSKGKLFSSFMSNLSDEVLRVTAPGFCPSQFRSPRPGKSKEVYSNLGSGSFLYLKGFIPSKVCHAYKFEGNIKPFEFMLWLPVTELVQSVFGISEKKRKSAVQSVSILDCLSSNFW